MASHCSCSFSRTTSPLPATCPPTESVRVPTFRPVQSRLRSSLLGSPLLPRPAPRTRSRTRVNPGPVRAAKRVHSGRSLLLSCTLIATEGSQDRVVHLCNDLLLLVEEKKKDVKSGILSFECNSDAFESNVVHFTERYDTFLSMNDFHASPEYTQFLTEVRPLLSSPVLLAAYEYNNGQIGCMLNPIGPKGEGGLDDATGQGGSGGGASYKQTSQSVMQGISDREGWGLDNAVQVSVAQDVAKDAAAALARSLKSIFGGKK